MNEPELPESPAYRVEYLRIKVEDSRHMEDMGIVTMAIGAGVVALQILLGVVILAIGGAVLGVFGYVKWIEETELFDLLRKAHARKPTQEPKVDGQDSGAQEPTS